MTGNKAGYGKVEKMPEKSYLHSGQQPKDKGEEEGGQDSGLESYNLMVTVLTALWGGDSEKESTLSHKTDNCSSYLLSMT